MTERLGVSLACSQWALREHRDSSYLAHVRSRTASLIPSASVATEMRTSIGDASLRKAGEPIVDDRRSPAYRDVGGAKESLHGAPTPTNTDCGLPPFCVITIERHPGSSTQNPPAKTVHWSPRQPWALATVCGVAGLPQPTRTLSPAVIDTSALRRTKRGTLAK